MEIIKIDDTKKSDHLIKNVPDDVWDEFKRLAKINGLTVGKMFEILVTVVSED